MRISYLPHARNRMEERGISEEEVEAVFEDPGPDEAPGLEYPGRFGRTVIERVLPGRRLATKVVYNQGAGDELIVVTVERGRPRFPTPAE